MYTDQLHITNGDGAANLLKASSVEGDVLPWRDPMHHGPFPANLDLDAVANVRADYLAGTAFDADEVRLSFQLRNEHLRAASRYSEVVLWFEHDLLDQLQLLELLSWFRDTDIGSTALTLICIDRFPGFPAFRGIGELSCQQIETLLPRRVSVSAEQCQLAKTAWACFRSNDPGGLEELLLTDTAALPFLKSALQRHLQEYPWASDGLTRTERQILTLVATGVACPGKIFVENMALEDVLYIGDWPTYQIIASLCRMSTPLLSCASGDGFRCMPQDDIAPDAFRQQHLSVTKIGRAVLAGSQHARSVIHRDNWLGGVHLKSGEPMWMWDDACSRLIRI